MKHSAALHLLPVALLLICALNCGDAAAQGVNKCLVDGKTTYQAEPCTSGGKVLNLPAKASPEEERAAQKRHFDEVNRMDERLHEAAALHRNEIYRTAPTQAKAAPDCAALNKQVADAYGQRNGMIQGYKGTMVAGEMAKMADKNMNDLNARINAANQAANEAGCKP